MAEVLKVCAKFKERMKKVKTILPKKRINKCPVCKKPYYLRFGENHRVRNKWNLGLKWWLQEHEGLVYGVVGVVVAFLCVVSFIYFNGGLR